MATNLQQLFAALPADASRILLINNLAVDYTNQEQIDDLYRLIGQFGKLVDLRLGTTVETAGYAFAVFEDILQAQRCYQQLSNYAYRGQPLRVAYFKDFVD